MTGYAETYRRSLEQPEEFWAEAAQAIEWLIFLEVTSCSIGEGSALTSLGSESLGAGQERAAKISRKIVAEQQYLSGWWKHQRSCPLSGIRSSA